MERNNYSFQNFYEYKCRLSPLGQKIFHVLLTQWKTEQMQNTRCIQRRHESLQNKSTLSFSQSNTSLLPPFYERNLVDRCDFKDNEPFNFVDDCFRNIATSDELLQYQPKEEINRDHISRTDLLHSAVAFVENPSNDMIVNLGGDKVDNLGLYNESMRPLNSTNNAIDVPWDDMFDTELLPDAPTIKDDTYAQTKRNVTASLIHFPQDNSKNSSCKIQNEKIVKNNNKITEMNAKITKRKKEKSGTDKTPKGLEAKKPNLRKQKYTKTIKNWLDDVDSNNPVEGESDSATTEQNSNGNKPKEVADAKIANDKVKIVLKKKIVQAKLANKEGKMKFDKPQSEEKTNVFIGNNNSSIDTPAETENENIKKDNTKTSKPKFVAPVKSQAAIKEITFDIHVIDDSNSEEYFIEWSNVVDQEICAILVYSNGFCQLNSQYTEDDCIPEGVMVCLNDNFYYCKKTVKIFNEMIGKFFQHKTVVCYDAKSILIFLKSQFDLNVNFIINDIKIGSSLLEPDNPPESFAELQKLLALGAPHVAATCVLQKAARYTSLVRECAAELKCSLIEDSLWELFVDIEMRLLPIVAGEHGFRGICVDVDKLKAMEATFADRMRAVEGECHRAAGKVFQVSSAAQVRALLYDELQLDTRCNVEIRETLSRGAKSTSETMLRSLVSKHPLPKLILEYRRLHKAHATFLVGVAQHVKDGVVKPTWVQTAAATGRMAANNPNVQAIPKAPFSLQCEGTDVSEQPQRAPALPLRAVYRARARRVLLAADFRHVECRVLAHAAADAPLLRALHSGDLFRALAADWLNKQEAEVTSEDRERTKRIVYASLYGAGARKLMEILDVSYEQALAVLSSFNRTFPSLKSFGRAAAARCAAAGGTARTARGRRRRLPRLASADPALRAHAERQAVNFLVQGTAADLCKIAIVRVTERLHEEGLQAQLLLQIHDELVWEVPEEDLLRAATVVKKVMENCGYECGVELPLPVALRGGRSWGELAELPQTEATTRHCSSSHASGTPSK